MLHQLTSQDKIMEQVDLDPWLSRQEAVLGKQPDGSFVYRVYLDDLRAIPVGNVRKIGCQIVYVSNDRFKTIAELVEGPQDPNPEGFTCDQRGMKER